jgi:HSP20 family protein
MFSVSHTIPILTRRRFVTHMMYFWNFSDLDTLKREIDRTFEQFFPRSAWAAHPMHFMPGKAARAYPLINISEDKENVYVEALAPGVEPSSLEASVVKNILTLSGEKAALEGVKPEAFHRTERTPGKFVRNVELPYEVNTKNVKADYTEGILVVTLPKAEEAKPRQITVNIS